MNFFKNWYLEKLLKQTEELPPEKLDPSTEKWLTYTFDLLGGIGAITLLIIFIGGYVLIEPYRFWSMIISILLMVPVVLIPFLYRNAIHFAEDDTSPSVDMVVFTSSIGVGMGGALYYHMTTYYWLVLIAFLLSILLYKAIRQNTIKRSHSGFTKYFVFIILLIYCMSTLIFINCEFDNSKPKEFQSIIVEKEIKNDMMFLVIAPWDKKQENQRIKFYKIRSANKGDNITVLQRKGLLYFSWMEFELPNLK